MEMMKGGRAMAKYRLKWSEPDSTEDEKPVLSHGVLTEWNDDRGFGFITPDDGGQRVFLHVKSLTKEARRPVAGELFFYKLTMDERGRPRAEEAFQTIFDEKRRLPFHHSVIKGLTHIWPLTVLLFFFLSCKNADHVFGLLGAMFAVNSLLTVLFYWEDKHLAQYKYWRIPEKRLHIWEFLCGWPGALFAQQVFRHKRSKTSFMVMFWFCAIANVVILLLSFFFYANPTARQSFVEWLQEVASLSR